MTGVEPQTTGVGSDRSPSWGATTAQEPKQFTKQQSKTKRQHDNLQQKQQHQTQP